MSEDSGDDSWESLESWEEDEDLWSGPHQAVSVRYRTAKPPARSRLSSSSKQEMDEFPRHPTCRLCAGSKSPIVREFGDDDRRLVDYTFNIAILDIAGLPTGICSCCSAALGRSKRFRDKILHGQQLLKLNPRQESTREQMPHITGGNFKCGIQLISSDALCTHTRLQHTEPVKDVHVDILPVKDEPVDFLPVKDEPVDILPVNDEPVDILPVNDALVADLHYCTICKTSFSCKTNLTAHYATKKHKRILEAEHPDQPLPPEGKFYCVYCDKRFYRTFHYKVHCNSKLHLRKKASAASGQNLGV